MTTANESFVIGLDLGTSGLRVIAVAPSGDVIASSTRPISALTFSHGVHEQDPAQWWQAIVDAAREIANKTLPAKSLALAVTSTSGSLVAVDSRGIPVRPAILYDDVRAASAAQILNQEFGGSGWSASNSLPKALFIRDQERETWSRVAHLLHPADWIAGKLTGCFGVSDTSNALKLGYNAESGTWDPVIARVHLDPYLLPRVHSVGSSTGTITAGTARETLLPHGMPVLPAGTDGLSSLVASGAVKPGDANTTLGTTLVWKVLAQTKPHSAALYSHLHPSGLWAPGAASSAGPGALEQLSFDEMEALNHAAARYFPTKVLSYPLRGRGERFPFRSSDARGFVEGMSASADEARAAVLQGLAFVERWGYERMEAEGVVVGPRVFSTGGAARSEILSRLRAEVSGRAVIRSKNAHAAFGAAIVAASNAYFDGSVATAIAAMCKTDQVFEPESAGRFDNAYRDFLACCTKRGFVP